ncbi:amino acid adenylation domain-containing protein [Vibrio sp. Isolate24]|uniref:amino acid adenylation domain-containing protein n=1 Tax=Vibrio sp. Isolate24 TaxID=2908534 RepID=UPI001EFCAE4C|nr:amino acid adenylation domain-containing protein [Vibrio sp. Isolate24]MCG9679276.1 amino acid adenylation domain-containing protein [Vibrio sp. Isolate24]
MYYYNLSMYFRDVASKFSDSPAIVLVNESFSYSELSERAQVLACHILSKGCVKGDVVAIAHTKQFDSYAMMCACLLLGIAYVNIDVDSPAERNRKILETCGAKYLFGDQSILSESLSNLAQQSRCIFSLISSIDNVAIGIEQRALIEKSMERVDGSSIAYVMFTSGSTGTPKGVAVTHQNILHFIEWGRSTFSVTSKDIFANLSPMYFDNSVFDFYTALFSGASLAPITKDVLEDPVRLVTVVEELKCSIWFSVPSLLIYLIAMKVISKGKLSNIRSFSFGGEGYPKIELKKLYDIFSSSADIVNVYGPTECTCICSAYRLTDSDFDNLDGLPTLGQLNQNFDYMILDDNGRHSDSGELCLIGPNVAAGYFNDQERTDRAFVTLTQSDCYMKRMYKTGDLVRESQGYLYFLGRKDNQIKHMGYRIELEEIEHALLKVEHVNQAAVIYNRVNSAYGKIEAYISSNSNITDSMVIDSLSSIIPHYMIPSKVVVLDTLPKNANGKVDKKTLSTL